MIFSYQKEGQCTEFSYVQWNDEDAQGWKETIYIKQQQKKLTDEEYEELMKKWDYWRKQIADGDTSSAPRDWFESTIDYLFEKASENE